MSAPIRIAYSALTKRILAGRLNSSKTLWVGEKHDVSSDFHVAMVELLKDHGGKLELCAKGTDEPAWTITLTAGGAS